MRELKRYKEEAVVLLLGTLLFLAVRWLSIHYWSTPDIAGDAPNQYDMRSETETILWTILRMFVYTLASWIGLRIIMPAGYKWLRHDVVDNLGALSPEQRTNLTTRMWAILFFGLVLLAMSGCAPAHGATTRQCVVASATADVGVREATGRNDGPAVERYLAHVGHKAGASWCAAFVCYHLSQCGVANPRSAWSPALASVGDRVWTARKAVRAPQPGDVFTLYYPQLGRVGHAGIVTGTDGRYLLTVEGNTSGPGSREGDGVYARRRELRKVYAVTNYIADANPATAAAPGRTTGVQATAHHHRYAHHRAHRAQLNGGATRYFVAGPRRPGAPVGAAAAAGAGPVPANGAQRSGLGERELTGWPAGGYRWLRHHGHSGPAMGPVHQGAPGEGSGAHGTADRRAQGGAVVCVGQYRRQRHDAGGRADRHPRPRGAQALDPFLVTPNPCLQ
ncbi:MAG: CHAP domain-containing protein [Flavobacteriales bacterium]|nr:CHAP domain-containing protein [Flavobacteriales bacterium]